VHTDLEERLEQCYDSSRRWWWTRSAPEERDIAQNLGAAAAVYLESTLLGNEIVGISRRVHTCSPR
jgi:DNA-binding transcriptional regulator LsrR (DeoR family)